MRASRASASLEGWPRTRMWPSFEARKSAHLRMTAAFGGESTSLHSVIFPACQNAMAGGAFSPADPITGRAPDQEAAMGQDARSPRGPRCIALVGPFQSGKTTLLEAILARTGAIPKAGTVEAGTSVGDSSAEARRHKMGVGLTAATTNFMGDSYTFVDCPGSIEFAHDMRAAIPAVDAAVVVCEADERKLPQLQ